jgi:hypothetical protein
MILQPEFCEREYSQFSQVEQACSTTYLSFFKNYLDTALYTKIYGLHLFLNHSIA